MKPTDEPDGYVTDAALANYALDTYTLWSTLTEDEQRACLAQAAAWLDARFIWVEGERED